MPLAFVHPGRWVLWAFFVAVVTSAYVHRLELVPVDRRAKHPGNTIRIEEISPSPEIQRQFDILGQSSSPYSSEKHVLTAGEHYWKYRLPSSDIVLDIGIDEDISLNPQSVDRLLSFARQYYEAEAIRIGEDTLLARDCYAKQYPFLPGRNIKITVQTLSRNALTYGMVLDVLDGIVDFLQEIVLFGQFTVLIQMLRGRPPESRTVGYVRIELVTARADDMGRGDGSAERCGALRKTE
ncbi:MAG: hypothetical protein Q9169_007386 [Polycauliona sp. 2 TL-2023]